MKRIAVIGAGAAGLVVAGKLAAAGTHVTVFERGAQVGGRARSEELDGCTVDTGAQLFGSGYAALFRTARMVGAEALLVRSPGRDAVYRNGRLHPITYGSVASMVRSSALPTALKLKLGARYVPFLLRHARQLDASDPLAAGGDALDGVSVKEWGMRELGHDFVELLAYPLLGAYYGTAPEQMSVVVYHALARAGMDVSVFAVRGGTGALMNALADYARAHGADVHVRTDVQRVLPVAGGVRVQYAGGEQHFDGAVLAVPAPHVLRLMPVSDELGAWLEGVQFAPSAVLALVLDEPPAVDFFGASLLREDTSLGDVVAICAPAHKAKGLVPADRGLLLALGSPAANAALVAAGEAAVTRMVDTVERVFPGTAQHIMRAKLYRHVEGYPVFYPGYLRHLRKFPANALPPGIRLAGDYLVAPTVEGAVRSGERAADALLRYARERA